MKFILYGILGIALSLPLTVSASDFSCAEQRNAIETQIKNAQQYNDGYKTRKLKQQLIDIDNNCSDRKFSKAINKDIEKLEHKISKQNSELNELKSDLESAQTQGSLSKQTKYQQKLIEKQADINKLNSELELLKQRVVSMNTSASVI